MTAEDRIDRVARETFGFERLRAGQREAIEAVLAGRDTLVVMSTGSGKSAIYQIAALLIPGATVVVSPLIALQREQVDDLRERAAGAAQLNSTVPAAERDAAFAELAEDALEFVFLAPEQLANPEVLDELAIARPSLLVVDEAHCISEWGHDFRPEYLRLGAAAEALGRPAILALTATAAPPVREEIASRLGMRDPVVIVRGFDRPNIRLAVARFHDEDRKLRALREHVAAAAPPGIVYVATRRAAEELAAELRSDGLRAASYHGGMRSADRDEVQERFMDDDLDVVVATTAFGMGVDKPNVRWVVHAEIAESLDSYYQEVGRAGRDGEPAEAVLFYRTEDLGLRRFFSGGGQVDVDEIGTVLAAVEDAGGPVQPSRLQDETELSQTKLATAVSRLEEVGAVEVLPDGEVAPAEDRPPRKEAISAAADVEARRRAFDRSRVDMMRAYAETDTCRRGFVLSYFGEPVDGPCGHCDNCEAGRAEAAAPPADLPFDVGARVAHEQWGEGVVQRYDDEALVVLFDDVGYKTLALELVVERDLLRAA
ncbi:MAG TPA: ATP-dependent DNA helicase RecQ [Solirubrobacteraceae bacterium]|nr:ATP-dependent DNA helicase RecQ [Solirubrobacteraceae bacterium]